MPELILEALDLGFEFRHSVLVALPVIALFPMLTWHFRFRNNII